MFICLFFGFFSLLLLVSVCLFSINFGELIFRQSIVQPSFASIIFDSNVYRYILYVSMRLLAIYRNCEGTVFFRCFTSFGIDRILKIEVHVIKKHSCLSSVDTYFLEANVWLLPK